MEKTIDNAAISGQKVKILCRNSYERRQAHEYAEQKGLSHRSIIDYTQMHVNQDVVKTRDSGCCRYCDSFKVTISGTPYSFVEVNNGYTKEEIGNKSMLPPTEVENTYGNTVWTIQRKKDHFKELHKNNLLVVN